MKTGYIEKKKILDFGVSGERSYVIIAREAPEKVNLPEDLPFI